MHLAELCVEHLAWLLPTHFLRLLCRIYMKLIGPTLRKSDVVLAQIRTDTTLRSTMPVTEDVDTTNEQLYGNDAAFFKAHLGPKLKYSACEMDEHHTLADAEALTIARYQELAGLDALPRNARVLELGCGWGSLSLENAARYPHLRFTGFSNSPQQIAYVEAEAKARGLKNLRVFVEDYAVFVDPTRSRVAPRNEPPFDAAIAIETIEHAKNISELLSAVALRLRPGAKLFVQSLLHQSASYLLDETSWMGRNFFTGGSILSLNSYFHLAPPELHLAEVSPVLGTGYSRTLLAWLELLEGKRNAMVRQYGTSFYEGFRMFYISCAEAFAANDGAEFMVGYYTFVKRRS